MITLFSQRKPCLLVSASRKVISYQKNDTWNHEIFVIGFVIVCLGCFPFSHILSFSFHFSQFLSISKSAYPEKNFSHTIYVESFDIRIR